MSQKIVAEININVKKGELESANKQLSSTKETLTHARAESKSFSSCLKGATLGLGALGLAAQGASMLKDIFAQPLKDALNLNIQYENLSNSLASLISVNHDNLTTTGENLNAQEKWALSLEASKHAIDDLRDAGIDLGYSVADMSEMFKGFYSTAGGSMSLDQAKSAMKAIAAAANVSGVSVDSLKLTLDSLGSGIAQTSTDFGRFVNAMGLSTEVMQQAKAEGKLYEVIMEKLSPLSESAAFSSNSYSVSLSKLNAAMDSIKQTALSAYFENVKGSIANLTSFLNAHKNEIIAVFDTIFQVFKTLANAIFEASSALRDVFAGVLEQVVGLFGEGIDRGSIFAGVLKSIQSVAVILAQAFKMVVNNIILAVNTLRVFINQAQVAYHAIASALSFGEGSDHHQKQLLALQLKDKELRAAVAQSVQNYGDIWSEGIEQIKEIWSDKVQEEQDLTLKSQTLLGKKGTSSTQNTLHGGVRPADLLKSYFENEFIIRERQIALLNEGKQKELELEKLRYDRVITNLNLELDAKLKLGQISQDQANRLYDAELKLHSQKMQHIKEYDATFEMLKGNINSALDESINNALSGNFTSFKDTFTDLFASLQSSITKGFANSIAQAFMESEVMESMTKSLSGAINSLTGNNEASGGVLSGFLGENQSSVMQDIGETLGGFAIGAGAGGLVTSFLGDEQNKKKATNLALGGAAAGAAIGSFVPVIGTALGGLIGGISGALIGTFSSKKKETTAKGVQIWEQATKDSINASEFADIKETKKSFWGLSKKTKQWSDYYDASSLQLDAIKQSLRGFEYILEDIGGGLQDLSVSAGRYENYAQVANSAALAMIESFFNAPSQAIKSIKVDTFAIYNYWSEYAKSINKEVSVALSESLDTYINAGNTFTSWLYEFKGESANAAKFQAELAKTQVQRIQESLGVNDISIDTYLQYREQALKESFDPQTIEQINALGEALMQSADATKKYEQALKGENATKLNMIDPYLEKTKKLEELNTQEKDTSEKLQVAMLSTLKSLLRVSQESIELSLNSTNLGRVP